MQIVYKAENVGFGGSIWQVSRYVNGGGTKIMGVFTGNGWEQNKRDAEAFCASLQGLTKSDAGHPANVIL